MRLDEISIISWLLVKEQIHGLRHTSNSIWEKEKPEEKTEACMSSLYGGRKTIGVWFSGRPVMKHIKDEHWTTVSEVANMSK